MSLETVANITLRSDDAPKSLSISEQAFLNFNILRIRDSLGITNFFSDPLMGTSELGSSIVAPNLRGPTCLETDDPNRIISLMNSYGDSRVNRFLQLSNMEIAALQPKIELKKIVYEGNTISTGSPVYEGTIPFKTDSKGQIPSQVFGGGGLLTDSAGRGDDVQISNVSFSFKNQNPLGAGRIVDVKIEIVMSQGESLTVLRQLEGGRRMSTSPTPASRLREFRFTDLFVRPNSISSLNYNRNAYQIRANIGWRTEDVEQYSSQIGKNFRLTPEALESQEISLNLLLVNYDIAFRQDGKISLSLDYISTLEDAYEDTRTNIFNSSMGGLLGEGASAELLTLTEELNRLLPEVQRAEAELPALLREEFNDAITSGYADGFGRDPFAEGRANTIAATRAIINDPHSGRPRIEELQERIEAINSGLVITDDGTANTVLVHSRLLKHIHQSGRLFSFVIPKQQMIYYSEEYQKQLLGANPSLFLEGFDEIQDLSDEIFGTATSAASTTHFYRTRGSSVPNFAQELTNELLSLPEINNDYGAAAKASGINLSQAFKNVEASGRAFTFHPVFGSSTGYRDQAVLSDPSNHTFYFFFYGDLVAAAMGLFNGQLAETMVDEKVGIILNSVSYTRQYPIPPAAFPSGSVATPDEEININLAHVPISLDSYFSFFKENIVDKKRDKMPIGDFIRETLTKLVAPALNAKSYGTKPKQRVLLKANAIEVSRTPISYVEAGGGTSRVTLEDQFDPLLTFIQPTTIISSTVSGTTGLFPTSFATFGDGTPVLGKFSNDKARMRNLNKYSRFSYINCYGTSRGTMTSGVLSGRYSGNHTRDIANGIYHLTPASSLGLVKDIRFSKRAMRYLAEASVFNALHGDSSEGFNRLWNVFDAEIVMVGNNLFVPGSLLYINTSNTGLGNPSSIATTSRILGLGGYYLVVSVDNTLVNSGAGNWETVVKAIWQSSGRNY